MASKPPSRRSSRAPTHRSTLSVQKTEVIINIYDLLPPGKLSSILWNLGSSLLHSGVQIGSKEYAYGGHDRRGLTGVYFTSPKTVPPGGTFRCEILHGFTVRPASEINEIIQEASDIFQGTSYNILTRNCNHFTAYLLERLTGRTSPSWLNRAASIGVALPCVVPKEWIAPPDFETADGDLVGDDEDEDDHHSSHERSRMLDSTDSSLQRGTSQKKSVDIDDRYNEEWGNGEERGGGGRSVKSDGKADLRDTSGRMVPPADRAPVR